MGCVPSSCGAASANGEPCLANSDCLNTCIGNVCADFSLPASVCDFQDAADCVAGLLCPAATCLQEDGGICTTDGVCVGVCNGSTCVPPDQPNGSACDENSDCRNTCIALLCDTPSGAGEGCDPADNSDCIPGFSCSGSRCLGELGAACDADADCIDICNGSTCVAAGQPNGATCDDDSDCANTCTGGVCADWMFGDHFVTTWLVGAGDAEPSITIHTGAGAFNYDVDWDNDGMFDEIGVVGDTTRPVSPGTYTVRIRGDFPHFKAQPHERVSGISPRDQEQGAKLQTVEQWGAISWQSMAWMLAHASNVTVRATDAPNMNQVTDMSYAFFEASAVNQPLDSWDTSNVNSMSHTFRGAGTFNQPLDNWDTSSVTDMGHMFNQASAFNQPLDSWDTSSVTDMNSMFSNSTFDQPIGAWDTAEVTDMSDMFLANLAFNQPLGSWDTSKVENMDFMFTVALFFNQPIGSWDTSSLTTMEGMFLGASAFNQSLAGWDTSLVTNMESTFRGAGAFDQSLGGWDVSAVGNMFDMLSGAGLSTLNYDATLSGWAALPALQTGVFLSANGLTYCTSGAARNTLMVTYGWTIVNDGSC